MIEIPTGYKRNPRRRTHQQATEGSRLLTYDFILFLSDKLKLPYDIILLRINVDFSAFKYNLSKVYPHDHMRPHS